MSTLILQMHLHMCSLHQEWERTLQGGPQNLSHSIPTFLSWSDLESNTDEYDTDILCLLEELLLDLSLITHSSSRLR